MGLQRTVTGQPAPGVISYLGEVSQRFPQAGLLGLLLVFLLLATLHSLIVPITQGEDELAHYRYISFIAQTGRLPVNDVERQQAWYRADWPPLYHLLVGWVAGPFDTTQPHLKDVGESPRRRLVGQIFYPRLIIYTEDANWPWRDGILVWHLGRFISILFSAGALIFTYLTVLEMCVLTSSRPHLLASPLLASSRPRVLALMTTALLAFTPRYLFTSAMLGDDGLLILLSAIFIWLLLRALRGDDRGWLYAGAGLALGLSIATKYSTALLPLAVIPVVWWRARRAGWRWPQWLGRVALSWLATLIGAGWWFAWLGYYFNTIDTDGLFLGLLRPLLASGPDVSMRRIFSFFGGGHFTGLARPEAIEAGTWWQWLTYMFQTFWGTPVLEHDPLFPWAYVLMLAFCGLALFGLWRLAYTVDPETRVTLGLLVLIIGLLVPFPLLRFFLTHNVLETGQGRHILYPAAQSIPILLMLGWVAFLGRTHRTDVAKETTKGERTKETAKAESGKRKAESGKRSPKILMPAPRSSLSALRSSLLAALPPLFLLLWSIFQLVYMTVTYPVPLPVRTTTFESASIPQPLSHNFGDDIEFLGYDFAPDPAQAIVKLTLFWRSIKPVSENYRIQVRLIDPAGRPHLTWLSHPLDGRYPTRAWDPGDVIRDVLFLPLAGMLPNAYTLQLNLLHEAEDIPLAGAPLPIAQFDLPGRPPLTQAADLADGISYRLWTETAPAHYRQTLVLAWTEAGDPPLTAQTAGDGPATDDRPDSRSLSWALIGPDDAPRLPAATGDATAVFIVGADWPSGDYRLQVEIGAAILRTGPLLTVANDLRLFDLPLGLTTRPDWVPVTAIFADAQGQKQVELSGYTLPTRRVEPGGGLPLTLYWQSLAPVLADLLTFAVLLDARQQPHGSIDHYPAGFYSPILWAQGEVVIDNFSLPVQADAPPGIYTVHLGQYRLVNGQPQSLALLQDGRLTETTAVVIGPIKVGGPPAGVTTDHPKPQITLNQSFGNQVTLLGYDLTDQNNRPIQNQKLVPSPLPPVGAAGQTLSEAEGSKIQNPKSKIQNLKLTLYWRAETNLPTDYTTFLHLRNAANETIRQKDNPPAAGRYPTSLWEVGEIVVDEISLPLQDLPPGRYTPVVGLYDAATGIRLAVPGVPANEVALEPIQVTE